MLILMGIETDTNVDARSSIVDTTVAVDTIGDWLLVLDVIGC